MTKHPFFLQRPQNNSYRYGAYVIRERLMWDLNPESWKSRNKLIAYKDKYIDKKAIIVCNGPSLLKSDLSLIENIFTFGLNKINLLFKKSSFRPSCIVSVNPYVIKQNSDFYNQTDIPLFLDSSAINTIQSRPSVTFIHSSSQVKFAKDCSMSIFQGYTVTFVAIQLAFHMGFRKIALIGCDHNFAVKGPANEAVIAKGKDNSHFDPNYFAEGVTWQLPDLAHSEAYYALARSMFEVFNGRIINASEDSSLEVFDRMTLQEFIDL